LANGLSDIHSIEILKSTLVMSEGSENFLALCESLRGKMALRYLDVRFNAVPLDGFCTTALKLETLRLDFVRHTAGMALKGLEQMPFRSSL
jgi:hypothetical protein